MLKIRQGKNFEDHKCHWGYITLCMECVKAIITEKIRRPHIDINKEVKTLPLMTHCENCGIRVSPLGE